LYRSLSLCHDPAPPETYTLSLHDALPILYHGTAFGGIAAVAGQHDVVPARQRPADGLEGLAAHDDGLAHGDALEVGKVCRQVPGDRKSTRLNSSHVKISYAVFCLKKKKKV